MGGWAQGHFTENLVYFLTKNLIDEDYRLAMIENKYTILDIPTNTLFYNSPEINISDNYIENFSKKIYTVMNIFASPKCGPSGCSLGTNAH